MGIYSEIDTFTIAPGHAGGYNSLMEKSFHRLARLFRDTFAPSLLYRHKAARKSAYMRYAGESPTLQDQITTMCLNCEPKDRAKTIIDKTILVVDDFITQGFTTEWARHLLLNAGAKQVITVAIGAFHDAIEVQSFTGDMKWDSFRPVNIEDKYIRSRDVPAIKNQRVIETIVKSYEELTNM